MNVDAIRRADEPASCNPLKQLEAFGQAAWLDFIQRSFIAAGELKKLVDRDGLKGITSNPAIFEKAMGHGDRLRRRLQEARRQGRPRRARHLRGARDRGHPGRRRHAARPSTTRTGKADGYVSLEVSPYLALRTDETIAEARRLWKAVDRAN